MLEERHVKLSHRQLYTNTRTLGWCVVLLLCRCALELLSEDSCALKPDVMIYTTSYKDETQCFNETLAQQDTLHEKSYTVSHVSDVCSEPRSDPNSRDLTNSFRWICHRSVIQPSEIKTSITSDSQQMVSWNKQNERLMSDELLNMNTHIQYY